MIPVLFSRIPMIASIARWRDYLAYEVVPLKCQSYDRATWRAAKAAPSTGDIEWRGDRLPCIGLRNFVSF